ncbi:unnamed protein product [Phyllotreta striolata]|uniref:Cationic amino acid transporter C-terminal domain-containing protein n=1 Tax=Phyllotreta striolata TaxID=444603 RepID=A0A9N9TY56_PHYSR|nr:unnamed protein product [Phyllotreta striolata]
MVLNVFASSFSGKCRRFFGALNRKKLTSFDEGSPLNRCLNLVDLTALGVGATLGLGVYVLAGSVAKTVAGPAVCISFLVAAVASAVAGLCYAEFAARVPKAGSAYVYSYVSVGEFVAFVIGWNLILEYVIGTASVASGMSSYIDSLVDKKIQKSFREAMPIDISFLSPYPDFLSFTFVMVLTLLLAFGVKESSLINNVFTVINLLTILLAIIAGSIHATTDYWKIDPATLSEDDRKLAGNGGFIPFGVTGIMEGAAKCFYGFVGFDAVATTGEEAKNPQRDIPLAIVISLAIIFGAYFSISTVLTMAVPYYLQDSDAPFPAVFDRYGLPAIKWIVTIGAVFALCTSMLGAMFPLPRVLYAMSNDGIIFKQLSKVHKKTKTPIVATLISGLLSGIMAIMFDLDQLIDMMSIGTLMAYTIVAISVLLLRYEPDELDAEEFSKPTKDESAMYRNLKNVFNLGGLNRPTKQSSIIVNWSIVLFSCFTALFCAIVAKGRKSVFTESYYLAAFVITVVGMGVLMVIMIRQPMADVELSFKVPLVPYIPCLSVVFNLYLMFQLDLHTWIRFLAWLFVGLLIYFMYGISHSEEREEGRAARMVRKEHRDNENKLKEDERKMAEQQEKEVTSF